MSGVSTAAPPRQVRLEAPPTPPPAKPLAPHLIERESGVHALQEALKEAVAGQGALVVVDGAGGTGKSSLLDVARQRAAELGIQTLAARGRELETEFPFGLALELFEEAVAAAGSEARRQLLAGAAGLSAPLFDSPGPKAFLPSHDQGFALLHGLYWLTHNLAERTPLLIAVDDAQWADLPSLRFLVYLAERLEHVPIALVVSMRTSEVRHQPLLLQLRGQRQARVLELRPLTAEGTSELVHACLPRPAGARGNRTDNATHAPACSICRAFYEVTKGNPLLVREYLGAVRGEDLEAGEETAGRLRALTPPTLARIIQARLGRLSTQALSTARAIAVLGEHARLDHVAAVADISDSAAHAAVDELVAAEIAAPENRPSLLHPVVQTITYGDLSESERSNLHERAARVLAAAGLPPEKLASHLLRTHPKGDDWVVATLWPAAVRASAAGSPQATVQYLRRALSEPPLPEVRPDLLADLGTAEAALGDPMAVDHLNDAVRFTRSRPRRAAVLADIGRTLRRYGRHREAAQAFEQGLALNRDDDPELALLLEAGYLAATRFEPALRHGAFACAQSLLAKDPHPNTLAGRAALAEVAFEHALLGTDRSQVVLLARWALELGSEDRRADGSTEDSWIYTAAGALVWAEDLDVAEQVLGHALDEARRRGSIMAVAKASYRRALSLYRRGRLTDAICDAEEAVGARRHGWELYLPAAHGVLARAWLDRGNLEAAVQALDVGDAEDRWSETNLLALYKEARGRLRLRQGEPGAAFDDFIDAGRILTEVVRAFNPAVSEWRSGAAIAASQLGDEAEARRMAQEELDLARRFAAPAPISAALRASARVEGREAALELLPEALSVLEGSPAELERARTLVELGTALRQTNRRAQAVDLLREGRELAHRCGAASLADRAGKEVLAAGARPRRLAVAGPEALTGSARRVAELAAKGNTNRQIAEHLFVTVKAVEWHLGNVYAKLGISSRRQLPAALAA